MLAYSIYVRKRFLGQMYGLLLPPPPPSRLALAGCQNSNKQLLLYFYFYFVAIPHAELVYTSMLPLRCFTIF